MDWIETVIGLSPDGGSGAIEFQVLGAILMAVGLVFAARRARRRS